ncbi:hypothetical protein [Geothrix sp. SG200]|uniref:hypothetical protein n=1 Tax=Geothrix sp. SG200 TaxID=2922865 RepID=UPI001FAE43CA|nr:hypothetical protein [Geothrix sp. SG200]
MSPVRTSFACAALASLLSAQTAPSPAAIWEPASPVLAKKAPGSPAYGLVLTTSLGKLLATSLAFDPGTHKPQARVYRIDGPAGWGPYRSGLERSLMFSPAMKRPADNNALHWSWYRDYFSFTPAEKGSAADEAGLDQSKYALTRIKHVDQSTFQWDVAALVYHITQSPAIVVQTIKLPLLFGPSERTYTIQNRRVTTLPAPDDADLVNAPPNLEAQKALASPEPWRELLKLRSQTATHAPLPGVLDGRKVWIVRLPTQPANDKQAGQPGALEFWKTDPGTGAFEDGLVEVYPEPPGGFGAGQSLRVSGVWYRLQALSLEPATGRLTRLALEPWKANVPALLAGRTLASELGSQPQLPLWESLEQTANDTLLEWKTLTFPGELEALDLKSAGALVVRIEKGMLALDLEVKGIRTRLDAATRATAEWKAQAELAAKEGRPAPATPAPSAESERLADLLDQRKAILMAVLGNAKQALASLRK